MTDAARFVTGFADQAVLLPLIAGVAALLLLLGWRRGGLAWLVGTAATLGLLLAAKVLFAVCDGMTPGLDLHSPSGHTGAATAVYGTLLALAARRLLRRPPPTLVWTVPVAATVGVSRLVLGVHTVAEVLVGGDRRAGRGADDARHGAAPVPRAFAGCRADLRRRGGRTSRPATSRRSRNSRRGSPLLAVCSMPVTAGT